MERTRLDLSEYICESFDLLREDEPTIQAVIRKVLITFADGMHGDMFARKQIEDALLGIWLRQGVPRR